MNSMEKEPKQGFVRVMLIDELSDICPMTNAWYKGRNVEQAYLMEVPKYVLLLNHV